MDWRNIQQSLDTHSETVNRLMRMCVEWFQDENEEFKKRIFNPLNILFVRRIATEKRGIYKVHLDMPIGEVENTAIKSYHVKANNLKSIQDVLGDDYIIIGQDLICPLNRIRTIDKTLEYITLRRMVLSHDLERKLKIKREVRLRAGREILKKLIDSFYEEYWIMFTKNSLIENSILETTVVRFGKSVYFNPMDIAFLESKRGIKTVQLRQVDPSGSKCPVYQFRNRTAMSTILGNNIISTNDSDGVFVQINKWCFVNIYCLMSPGSLLQGMSLSLQISGTKKVEIMVGDQYLGLVVALLNSLHHM